MLLRNSDWTRALLDLMAKYARGNWYSNGTVGNAMREVPCYALATT